MPLLSADMDTDALLVEASSLHLHGDFAAAEAIYAQLLEAQPNHTEALYLLGTLELQLSKPRQALARLKRLAALDPSHIQGQLNLALAFRDLGQVQEAARCYWTVIATTPTQAQAYFGLGELAADRGNVGEALQYWGRAAEVAPELGLKRLEVTVEAWPDRGEAHAQLGRAYLQCGRHVDAMHSLEKAIKLGEDSAACCYDLARCYAALGLTREAEITYRHVLQDEPGHAEAADALGVLLQQVGHVDQAMADFQQALAARPDFALAHYHLGSARYQQGDVDGAVAALRRAVDLGPSYAPARNNLAVALKAQGRLEEAEQQLREAVRLAPDYSEAYNNLGNVLSALDRLEEAECFFRLALNCDRTNVQAYNNLGIVMQAMGANDAALQCFDTALLLRPNFARAHWNRALALLLRGEYETGFREYDWGFDAGTRLRLDFGKPQWRGTIEHGKTLLVHAEQGFGDTIQFVRYLRRAKTLVGKLILACPPDLTRLFQGIAGADQALADNAALPDFDYHIPLMSLPGAMQMGLLGDTAYLSVVDHRDFPGTAFKVGLVWAGLPTHQHDMRRSCRFGDLRPILDTPGTQFFSLQKGPSAAQLDATRVLDLGRDCADFADAAAAIAGLDLVITVDTAVAHLAGAMGKPVWVLLASAPDWRWGEAGETTEWYPSMRLFRQTQRGDWGSVIAEVAAALRQIASSGKN